MKNIYRTANSEHPSIYNYYTTLCCRCRCCLVMSFAWALFVRLGNNRIIESTRLESNCTVQYERRTAWYSTRTCTRTRTRTALVNKEDEEDQWWMVGNKIPPALIAAPTTISAARHQQKDVQERDVIVNEEESKIDNSITT